MNSQSFYFIGSGLWGRLLTLFFFLLFAAAGVAYIWWVMTRSGKPQEKLEADLVGSVGKAASEITTSRGRVRVDGKNYRALGTQVIAKGAAVRVVATDGLVAKVAPAEVVSESKVPDEESAGGQESDQSPMEDDAPSE